MKLALDCPTKKLELLQPFADIDYISLSRVIDDELYCNFFKSSTREVILNTDGLPYNAIVDGLERLGKGGAFIIDDPAVAGELLKSGTNINPKLVSPVVNGNSLEDVLTSVYNIEARVISIPFHVMCDKEKDSPKTMTFARANLVSKLTNSESGMVILLGMSSMAELKYYSGNNSNLVLVTGAPILLGLKGKDILDTFEVSKDISTTQMGDMKLTQEAFGIICRNIALLRKEMN